tara:strand:+ start:384 stop:2444 length:2061 start_codon:yes stop_codon:yes gene_type:complete
MIKSLSQYLSLPKGFLGRTLYGQKRNTYYNTIEIPKRNGGVRILHAVNGRLKTLQKKTYEKLSEDFKPSSFAKGFVKKSSIIKHAKIHRNKKILISFDIKDFFPSITWARVFGMFKAQPFNFPEEWAMYLAQICCLDDNGPIAQGAVTSPYISNMLCRKLDSRLSKFAQKEQLDYSRYADDITFSTNKIVDVEHIKTCVEKIVNGESFELNHEKTRLLQKHQRQVVTGIIVNDGLNVSRKYINNTKALIHNCMKDGLFKQMVRPKKYKDIRNACPTIYQDSNGNYFSYRAGEIDIKQARKLFLYHIFGRIQYIGQVARANKDLDPNNYRRRNRIYENLAERYYTLIDKEKIEGSIAIKARNELIKAQNESLINDIKEFDKSKLNDLVEKESIKDPRFFTKSFAIDDISKFKSQVIELKNYPIVSQDMIVSLLGELRDSRNTTLGKIVHLDNVSSKEVENSYKEFRIKKQYFLPKNLRNNFENLYKVLMDVITKNKEDVLKPKNHNALMDSISSFKKATRFGNHPDESTIFIKQIEKVANRLHIENKKYDKRIEIDWSELNAISFYSDVKSVLAALNKILKSMYKHTDKSDSGEIKISSEYDNKDVVITITSNQIKEIKGFTGDRKLLANGKIRNAIFMLNGLCDYSIIAKFVGIGWKEQKMMKGEKAIDAEQRSGFTHILRFSSCV